MQAVTIPARAETSRNEYSPQPKIAELTTPSQTSSL